ncbi:MAG: TfoX/Sxy family protein [Nitrospirae bacterium]|nr:TfoX/Sxy family protein [Nitrospirota bacterium]
MAVSSEFLDYVRDQLTPAGRVTVRRMFGGVGIYLDGLFCALIDDDVLYLKVDDRNRDAFLAAGCGPFRPTGPDGMVMNYHPVPAHVLEDADTLAGWARTARQVAADAKPKGRRQ